MTQPSYEALYRNKELAVFGRLGLVVAMPAAIGLALVLFEDGNAALPAILSAIGGMVVGTILPLPAVPRVHRWTIEEKGVRIEERARAMGPRRSAFVAFADIAALRNPEGGFDGAIELVTRNGAIFRLMRPRSPLVRSKALEALPALQPFGAALTRAITASAAKPVPLTEGLSLRNRGGDIAVTIGFPVFSIVSARAALWRCSAAASSTARAWARRSSSSWRCRSAPAACGTNR